MNVIILLSTDAVNILKYEHVAVDVLDDTDLGLKHQPSPLKQHLQLEQLSGKTFLYVLMKVNIVVSIQILYCFVRVKLKEVV